MEAQLDKKQFLIKNDREQFLSANQKIGVYWSKEITKETLRYSNEKKAYEKAKENLGTIVKL